MIRKSFKYITSLSFSSCVLPDLLKTSIVPPVFKRRKIQDHNSYRSNYFILNKQTDRKTLSQRSIQLTCEKKPCPFGAIKCLS